jgi:hypothetical protein
MTKQTLMTKQEKVINSLKEKLGEKMFNRTSMIATERFGQKENLKIKFYQSILEGYINPSELWTNDDTILSLKSKIDSVSDNDKEKIILEILDTYDTKDPKIKELLRKYERYLKKFQSEVKVENLFKVSLPN